MKKASSEKKDKLTKFNISSGSLDATRYAWFSILDWKQQLTKSLDLISHLSNGRVWMADAATLIWKWGLGVLWILMKEDDSWFALFFRGWGTRRQLFAYMKSEWIFPRYRKSQFLLCYVCYPFPSTSMASEIEQSELDNRGCNTWGKFCFLCFSSPFDGLLSPT